MAGSHAQPPLLDLSFSTPPHQSFKRSFHQFGLDIDSPGHRGGESGQEAEASSSREGSYGSSVNSSSSGGSERNKRQRSETREEHVDVIASRTPSGSGSASGSFSSNSSSTSSTDSLFDSQSSLFAQRSREDLNRANAEPPGIPVPMRSTRSRHRLLDFSVYRSRPSQRTTFASGRNSPIPLPTFEVPGRMHVNTNRDRSGLPLSAHPTAEVLGLNPWRAASRESSSTVNSTDNFGAVLQRARDFDASMELLRQSPDPSLYTSSSLVANSIQVDLAAGYARQPRPRARELHPVLAHAGGEFERGGNFPGSLDTISSASQNLDWTSGEVLDRHPLAPSRHSTRSNVTSGIPPPLRSELPYDRNSGPSDHRHSSDFTHDLRTAPFHPSSPGAQPHPLYSSPLWAHEEERIEVDFSRTPPERFARDSLTSLQEHVDHLLGDMDAPSLLPLDLPDQELDGLGPRLPEIAQFTDSGDTYHASIFESRAFDTIFGEPDGVGLPLSGPLSRSPSPGFGRHVDLRDTTINSQLGSRLSSLNGQFSHLPMMPDQTLQARYNDVNALDSNRVDISETMNLVHNHPFHSRLATDGAERRRQMADSNRIRTNVTRSNIPRAGAIGMELDRSREQINNTVLQVRTRLRTTVDGGAEDELPTDINQYNREIPSTSRGDEPHLMHYVSESAPRSLLHTALRELNRVDTSSHPSNHASNHANEARNIWHTPMSSTERSFRSSATRTASSPSRDSSESLLRQRRLGLMPELASARQSGFDPPAGPSGMARLLSQQESSSAVPAIRDSIVSREQHLQNAEPTRSSEPNRRLLRLSRPGIAPGHSNLSRPERLEGSVRNREAARESLFWSSPDSVPSLPPLLTGSSIYGAPSTFVGPRMDRIQDGSGRSTPSEVTNSRRAGMGRSGLQPMIGNPPDFARLPDDYTNLSSGNGSRTVNYDEQRSELHRLLASRRRLERNNDHQRMQAGPSSSHRATHPGEGGSGQVPAHQRRTREDGPSWDSLPSVARTSGTSRNWGDLDGEDGSFTLSSLGQTLRRRAQGSLAPPAHGPEQLINRRQLDGSTRTLRDNELTDLVRRRHELRRARRSAASGMPPFSWATSAPVSQDGRTPLRRRFRNLGDYVRDEDFDTSYEGLLALAATVGDVKPRGTSANIIDSLPRGTYKEWRESGSDTRCPICLDDYTEADIVLKAEPCNHWCHKDCLQQWLHTAKTCPVCRGRVRTKDCPASPGPSHLVIEDDSPNDSSSNGDDSDNDDDDMEVNRRMAPRDPTYFIRALQDMQRDWR